MSVLRRTIVAIALTLALALPATAAGAKGGPVAPTGPRIVGGTQSPPGAWPSQAALLTHGNPDQFNAQFCGATILSPSWALTAGHCVHDEQGNPSPTATIDVLAGTQDLSSGGEREQAAEIRTAPGWNIDTLVNDVSVIRLTHPVHAPGMPFIGQGTSVAAGTDLVTTGWGNRSTSGNDFPTQLNEVHVPLLSDSQCQSAYPHAPNEFFPASMICAGLLGSGGKDSCNGDSGGPISAMLNGVWTEIGTVSWGIGCAQPQFPGVYSRLSAFSNWVKNQIRYGAEPDAASFVRQQLVDFTGLPATPVGLLYGVNSVGSVALSTYVEALEQSAQWQTTAGAVARLYRASFDRDADASGMKTWVGKLEHGSRLVDVANAFVGSTEFQSDYGSLDDADFVNLVYQNVLGRPADPSGGAYWTAQLDSHTKTRAQVMIGFSESHEFVTAEKPRTDITTTYFALLRRVPTVAEYTTWATAPNVTLVRTILGSYEYANRF